MGGNPFLTEDRGRLPPTDVYVTFVMPYIRFKQSNTMSPAQKGIKANNKIASTSSNTFTLFVQNTLLVNK